MSEKPGKQLVSRERYINIMGWKVSLLSGSVILFFGGIYTTLVALFMALMLWLPGDSYCTWLDCFCSALGSACAFLCSRGLYRKSKEIASVEAITVHNIHLLPSQEALVRASDLPPSHQQSELLRAAPQGSETPPEELLRANTSKQGER